MREYLTEVLVLDKKAVNETDYLADFYSQELGLIKAKITGGQKILSKLSSHLEPLSFSLTRLAQKNGFVVADALAENRLLRLRRSPFVFGRSLQLLFALREMIFPEEPDPKLWFWLKESLNQGDFSFVSFLKILGYDPKLAECQKCRSRFVKYFLTEDQSFFCGICASQIPQDVLLLEL